MVLLPAGFGLPPLPILVGLLVAAAVIGFGLYRQRPAVTPGLILALAPWMAVGSALHVLYVIEGLPPTIAPFAGTAAVYLTVATLAGAVWLVATWAKPNRAEWLVAATGGGLLLPAVGFVLSLGSQQSTLTLLWPTVGAVLSVPITLAGWWLINQWRPAAAETVGWVGLLALFGHVLDAVSTTVGVDILGFGERTPLSRLILDAAAQLPTASVIGSGWLFVLVKMVVVGGIVVLFADFIEETPTEGYLLVGFIAAVGLGPGVHNLLLFAVTGG